EIMISETEKIRNDYLKKLIGKTVEVLFENEIEKDTYQGYTKGYLPVRIKSCEDLTGKIMDVKIVSYSDNEFCIAE
ncbi:MAG: hypothetical protein ACI4RR_01555, partial [Eubacterium sp.]